MTSASGPGLPGATLHYDGLGRLREAGVAAAPVYGMRFLYDGDQLVGEYSPIDGTLRVRYIHGPGVDDPIAEYNALYGRRFYHPDERGSIVALSNDNGSVVEINTYDEWGIPGADNAGRFGYTGQVWSLYTGMNYYKARWYSPTLGRFMQTDPIGYEDGMNMYAYVRNDPVNGVDPTGLAVTCKDRICTMTADTYEPERSNGQTVLATPAMREAAQSQLDVVRVRTGNSEVLGFGLDQGDGSYDVVRATDLETNPDTSSGTPPSNSAFALHGHVETGPDRQDGMVDQPSLNGGFGDTSSISQYGIPNGTVFGNDIGWHEIDNGQLTFTYPAGSMTRTQRDQMQDNLDGSQFLFMIPR